MPCNSKAKFGKELAAEIDRICRAAHGFDGSQVSLIGITSHRADRECEIPARSPNCRSYRFQDTMHVGDRCGVGIHAVAQRTAAA